MNKHTPNQTLSDEKSERFVRLFAESSDRLERYIRTLLPHSQDVPDLMQEVAVALWKKFENYDESRPFLPWACRFAYYEAINFREKAAHRRMVLDPELIERVAETYERELSHLQARQLALTTCLKKLAKRDRELVESRYGREETVQKLAVRWESSVHKLYHSLDRIRTNLMICVERMLTKEGWNESA